MKLLCVALMLAGLGNGGDFKRVWIRRISLAAACAASVGFDTISTQRAIAAGARETNPLLADSRGNPNWGRMLGIKAAVCGASVFFQERTPSRTSDWTYIGVNAVTAGAFTATGLHNLNVANRLAQKP